MTEVQVVSVFVIGGKGKDVAVRQLDLDVKAPPENRAVLAAAEIPDALDDDIDVASADPTADECREALNNGLLKESDWRAGALTVLGRAIIDGNWIPIANAPQRFAYGYLLESKETGLPWQRKLPVRDEFLQMHGLIVAQEKI